MTAGELLVIRNLLKRIRREENFLKKLEALTLTAQRNSDGTPSAKRATSKTEYIALKTIESQAALSELNEILSDCRAELIVRLEDTELDEKEIDVLMARYGYCKTFYDIAEEMEFSQSMIFFLHKQALNKLGISRETFLSAVNEL